MSELVDPKEIERIVGTKRRQSQHMVRLVSSEQMVYVLHSHDCLAAQAGLRNCEFSIALDKGVGARWDSLLDKPVVATVVDGRLAPSSD